MNDRPLRRPKRDPLSGYNTLGLGGGRPLDDDVEDIEDKDPDTIIREARSDG